MAIFYGLCITGMESDAHIGINSGFARALDETGGSCGGVRRAGDVKEIKNLLLPFSKDLFVTIKHIKAGHKKTVNLGF